MSKKIPSLLLFFTISVLLTSCVSNNTATKHRGYYHSGIYFGKYFSPNYQQGIADGCTTAKGYYKKSRKLFNVSRDYNNGWFLGRNRCRNLLKINENGDLVL
jgi:hypothetical protein